ncbi:helix-turn-helix transcriptional regulator [Micromonospora sp. SL1-18]|uniref:helix-turn-helix transcriptional regulator n=1 Tax=Micromonospora sp. SL1-18 TaxID=3399128 RepID=UPI003A4D8C1C
MGPAREAHEPGERQLAALGIPDIDEQIYRVLLLNPRSSQQQLADMTSLATARVASALRRLEALGFVGRVEGRPRRYVPTIPDVAVETLVHVRESQLLGARAAVADLMGEYRAGRQDDPGELVEIVNGERAVAQRFAEIQNSCTTEILLFDRPPYSAGPDNPQQSEVLTRGIRWRTIYSAESLERYGARAHVRELSAQGEQARLLPRLPMKLVIADRRVALIPLMLETGIRQSAVIRRSTLLDALVTLFELYWSRALPLDAQQPAETGAVDDEDRQVLALLAAGAKDEAIARELGIGVRTLRRRMQRLLAALDADTRFQAGLQASRRGWL